MKALQAGVALALELCEQRLGNGFLGRELDFPGITIVGVPRVKAASPGGKIAVPEEQSAISRGDVSGRELDFSGITIVGVPRAAKTPPQINDATISTPGPR